LELSVIIPTYGRENDLEDCLNSVLLQAILPKEILIVDDTPGGSIERLCERKKKQFQDKKIDLFYIRNYKERSSAIARNIGIENAKGNIALFLDSDVILHENYTKKIWEVYRDFPDAVGVQGYITNYEIPRRTGLNKVFFLVHFEKNCNRLLPSIQNVYAGPLTKIINCQWLV
jgi:glycosyltransferase involved in cell wall biosynthesis